MQCVALVGSLREESFNRKLTAYIATAFQDAFELEIADIGALPHFNQDQELDPPQVVKDFKRQVAEADAVIIVSPEYNWSVPGVLKNAIDWLSRVNKVMNGKPVLVAGVSGGRMGTIRGQLHLRQILQSPGVGARMLPPGGREILVNLAAEKFDGNGKLIDESTREFVDQVVSEFVEWVSEESFALAADD